MEIKNSEWTEFAEFIADCSTHMVSQYWEDGTYTCCPFSTIERAYTAFLVWKTMHSPSEVRKFYDVDYEQYNPEHDALEEFWRQKEEEDKEYYAYCQKQAEIEECYDQQYPDCTWQDEWDTYISDREKQITRIAHELADKHENLPTFGGKSCVSLVYPFYKKYELNSDERRLFTQEYYTQHFFTYGYV
jgi:hypothetical protein